MSSENDPPCSGKVSPAMQQAYVSIYLKDMLRKDTLISEFLHDVDREKHKTT